MIIPNIKAICPDHALQIFLWIEQKQLWVCIECYDIAKEDVFLPYYCVVRELLHQDGDDYLWKRTVNGTMESFDPVEEK